MPPVRRFAVFRLCIFTVGANLEVIGTGMSVSVILHLVRRFLYLRGRA